MPRPSIKAPKATPKAAPKSKPSGLPRAKPKPAPESPELGEAQAAVAEFETQFRMLTEMRHDWDENYPEAKLALEDIKLQEDAVEEAIKRAKPLVARCKESVGDFKAQRKFSKPRYDPAEVTRLISQLGNGIEIFKEMLGGGIIKVIDLEAGALAWFAQRPSYSEAFQSAFKPEEELTTSVTVPKL